MREKLMNVFCVLVLLVGVGALWVVPAVIVFAERYPWSTEEQFLSNLDSCYLTHAAWTAASRRSFLFSAAAFLIKFTKNFCVSLFVAASPKYVYMLLFLTLIKN
jgi:hypothetical protein